MRFRRVALLILVALATVPLAACGSSRTTVADTEGAFLDVGPLQYQVQLSRQLNPHDIEDAAYLNGVDPSQAQLGPDEAWFAVFVQVRNPTNRAFPAATDFRLVDTQDNVYTPVPISMTNPWAYKGGLVAANGQLPPVQSVAYNQAAINGQMLLFKIRQFSFENRPLELTIQQPSIHGPQLAKVDLDV